MIGESKGNAHQSRGVEGPPVDVDARGPGPAAPALLQHLVHKVGEVPAEPLRQRAEVLGAAEQDLVLKGRHQSGKGIFC